MMRYRFTLRLFLFGFGFLFCLSSAFGQSEESETDDAVLAGHSYHGEAFNEGPRQQAYLMEGLGRSSFPVSTYSPLAQQFFNQGIDQLHGFWYFEAERSFRQVLILDPDCAMACWGLAMANINNPERARQFIEQARDKAGEAEGRVTDLEQMWIDCLADYYDSEKGDKKKRSRELIEGLEKIIIKYPDNIEAKAFLACQVWQNQQAGVQIASYVGVNSLLDDVFAADPMHPAHHYRIHLWDYRDAKQALESSALGGPSLPAIAHMWHMPGHIYSRLKRYEDAVWQQEASARVDHHHMIRDRVMPDQIHNFAHNNEWCIRNLNHIGRVRNAVDLAKNMISMPRHPSYNMLDDRGSAWYGRQRLFLTLSQYELWAELIELCDTSYLEPTDSTNQQLRRLRFLGRAFYRSGQPDQGDDILNQLQQRQTSLREEREERIAELIAEVEEKHQALREGGRQLLAWLGEDRFADFGSRLNRQMGRRYRADRNKARSRARSKFSNDLNVARNAIHELQGHRAVADGDFAKGHELLKKAGQVDAIYRAWLRWQFDDHEKVLRDIDKYIEDHENEVQPLALATWWLLEEGEVELAQMYFSQLREISGSIDMQSPVFTRLADYAPQLGISGDWRIASPRADDLGARPELDSLGPFRWRPAEAPEWELTDSAQQTVSLKQFQGRPVLVIFYLGHGCLHCAEQLQEFVPRADEFRDAGIEMLAISTDDQAGLQQSIADYGESEMPIPLLADPGMSVFKKYRAYDEFENQPLHGTFLIDQEGRIRWQDISYEPFMKSDFLLDEARRLLAIEEQAAAGSEQ